MSKSFSTTETAKLIRKALGESFEGIKFSVRSSVYAGGSSINVSWVDGPNLAQVEAVAKVFEGSYFDGSIDYKGSRYAMIDGQQVRFGADFIFCNREYSDALKQKAIDRVYRQFKGNFLEMGLDKPTIQNYNDGKYFTTRLIKGDLYTVQQKIYFVLQKMSDRIAVEKSQTAGKVIYLGNDGYSPRGALNAEALQ